MPKRIGVFFGMNESALTKLCKEQGLNNYETELIIRIYSKKQSLNYISDTMNFCKHGKTKELYSVRTINNVHKEAVLKILNVK